MSLSQKGKNGVGREKENNSSMGLDKPSHKRSAMDITAPITINSLAVVFSTGALTESGYPDTTFRFAMKDYV